MIVVDIMCSLMRGSCCVVREAVLRLIGEDLARLHNAGIVHGDPTTSNMIITPHHTSVTDSTGDGDTPLTLTLASVLLLWHGVFGVCSMCDDT